MLVGVIVSSPTSPLSTTAVSATGSPPACGTSGTPSVTSLANPTFYIDSGITPKLNATYAGYTIRAGSTSETNLRIELSGFDDVITLATHETGAATIPTMVPNSTHTTYFLLQATRADTNPHSHNITLYRGAEAICTRSFTYTRVAETIKALANKVDSVSQTAASTPTSVGDTVVVTVLGRTGILGQGPTYDPGVLSYAPNAIDGFPVNAWRLEKTELTIKPTGVGDDVTITDRLYLSGASGPDRTYTAKYYFRAVGFTTTTAIVRPVQYIASGTQVKHTDLSGSVFGELPPPESDADLSITKNAAPTVFQPVDGAVTGGKVTYEVIVRNTGGSSGTLDRIEDTLQTGLTYTSGNTKIGTRTVTPTIAGNTIIFYGPLTIPAGGQIRIQYDATVRNVAGTYVNSVVGYFANAIIDSTSGIEDSAPATASVTVVPAYGSVNAVDDSVSTSAGKSVLIDVLSNDTGDDLTLTVVRQGLGGTATVEGNKIRFTPSDSFGGVDTFTYRISNGQTSDEALVTVAVPKARYDEYVVAHPGTGNSTSTLTKSNAEGVMANDLCSADSNPLAPIQLTGTITTKCYISDLQIVSTSPALNSVGTLTATNSTVGGKTVALGSFTYTTPAANTNGLTSFNTINFTYKLNASYPDPSDNSKTITDTSDGQGRIYITNTGPDKAVTPYRTAKEMDVVGPNDTGCPSGCSIKSFDVTGTDGTVVLKSGSTSIAIYTPNPGFVGVDTYKYELATGGYAPVLATVLVAPPNGTYNTTYGESVTDVIKSTNYINTFYGLNKPSPSNAKFDCEGCEFRINTQPTKGTVAIATATGEFTYTPAPSSSGKDTFDVLLSEPTGLSVAHSIEINIGPKAVDDTGLTVLTKAATPLSFNVLDNDTCPTTCTVTVLSQPSSGTLTQTAAGSGDFTYSNNTDIGDVSFQYSIESDTSPGLTDAAEVQIRVEGAVDDVAETSPGQPVTINIRSNDPCTDCVVQSVTRPTVGTANLNTNGTVTYLPPNTFAGVATFVYTVFKNGKTTTAQVQVTVRPDARNDQYSLQPGQQIDLDVLINDICADCLITDVSATNHASSSALSTDPYSVRYTAPSAESGATTDSFTYTITDSTSKFDTATVSIIIATPPIAIADTSYTRSGVAIGLKVRQNDTCDGATCSPASSSVEVAQDPTFGAVAESFAVSSGESPTAYDFTYVPRPGFTGVDTFTYSVITSNGMIASAEVTVYVGPAASDDFVVVGTNTDVTIDVATNDACVDCHWILRSDPSAGQLDSFNSSGRITYQSPATPGTYTFRYKTVEKRFGSQPDAGPQSELSSLSVTSFAEDDEPGDNEAFATVTILVGDAAPDFVATNHNTPVTLNVVDNDSCKPSCTIKETDGVSSVLPGIAGTAIRLSTTEVQFTPASTFSGIATFTYTVVYGDSSEATATVTILVGPEPLRFTTEKNTELSGNLSSYMSCGTFTCTFEFKSNTGGTGEITINPDGSFEYTPANNFIGDEEDIIYTVTANTSTPLSRDGLLEVSVNSDASILLEKIGTLDRSVVSPSNRTDAGDVITYEFRVTNTGDLAVSNITITDNKISNNSTNIVCPNRTSEATKNVIASLEKDASTTCTATYTVTQTEINAGIVSNSATATGSALATNGNTVTVTDTDTDSVLVTRQASMTLEKLAGPIIKIAENAGEESDAEGDTITYTYTVSNTGNVTLTNAIVVDDKVADDAASIICPNRTNETVKNVIPSLAPGQNVTCTTVYALTAADITAKKVTNTATVTATPPSGAVAPSPASSSVTVLVDQRVTISLDKVATPRWTTPTPVVGDIIDYLYTVTNTGDTSLNNISVTDDKIIASGISCEGKTVSPTNVISTLAVAASKTCVASYTLTQQDLEAGSVTNIAIASTIYSDVVNGEFVSSSVSATDDATVGNLSTTEFSFSKDGVINLGSKSRIDKDDTITYTYTVTNEGTSTLPSLTITDDKIAAENISCQGKTSSPTNVVTSLGPGLSATCTAIYVVPQEDIDEGSITNIATATPASGDLEPETAEKTILLTQAPTVSMSKTLVGIDNGGDGISEGDIISYSYTVTNTGNVTLNEIAVTDDKITATDISCENKTVSPTNVIDTLSPGSSATCLADYEVTEADYAAAEVTNIGTASTTFNDTNVEGEDELTVSLANPLVSISLDGVLDVETVAPNDRADAGDEITYTYTVTNTGNVSLDNITVTDNKIPSTAISCENKTESPTNVIDTLSPGLFVTCIATYLLTQSNIDTGSIDNTATATTKYPNTVSGATVTDSDSESIDIEQDISVSITKVATVNNASDKPPVKDDTISYVITVTNTGNTTLNNLAVIDAKVSNLKCATSSLLLPSIVPTLAPGENDTCNATYSITQSDLDNGSVSNTASVEVTVNTTSIEEDVSIETPLDQEPAIEIENTAGALIDNGDPGTDPGDVIPYTYVVTNTGNVTLTNILVSSDGLVVDCNPDTDGSQSTILTLAPGASVECTTSYTIDEDDIENNAVTNIATAATKFPDEDGEIVTDSDTAVKYLALVSLEIEKTAELNLGDDDVINIGDTVTYTIRVTNTGSTRLSNIAVLDPMFDDEDITCSPGTQNEISSLDADTSASCTATHEITQADLTRGFITNTATATTGDLSESDSVTTTWTQPEFTPESGPVEAADDDTSGPMGAILEIEVLANDIGDDLTITSVDTPDSGTTAIKDDVVVFTPDLTFTGTATFNYTVSNGTNSSTGNVKVTVTNNLLQPIPEIFLDINGNGIRDNREPGIGGIEIETQLLERGTVRLRPGATSTIKPMSVPAELGRVSSSALRPVVRVSATSLPQYKCATTAGGSCDFGNVPMGSYKIEARFDPSKHGMKRTTASEDPSSLVGTSKPVGTAMTKVAFGVTGRCALRGRAYTNMNNNGRYDAGVDKVLKTSDLQVEWSGNDGVLGTDDDVLIVSRTSTTGRYSVENMPLGSYRVVGTERVINCSLTQAQLNDPSFTKVIATDLGVTPRTFLPKTGSDMAFITLTSLAVLLAGLFMSMLAWSRRRRFAR